MPFTEFTTKHFLGRTHEMEVLQRVAAEALTGDADSLILLGSRGCGKTELLKRLYNNLFHRPDGAIPFYYTIKSGFISTREFSEDFLSCFIAQALAYLKKDASFITSGVYSLDDLKSIAENSHITWASELIDHYVRTAESEDPVKSFLFVITAAQRVYRNAGIPVVVIIDDFHKIKNLNALNAGSQGRDLWMRFEDPVRFRHTPHILAGFRAELHKMFFEESSMGEYLELVSLPGLNRKDSSALFSLLCEKYAVSFSPEAAGNVDVFGGNPFYIKSFVQAARQTSGPLSEDGFWEIYFREITGGKAFIYWTSILKARIPGFELRKPSLKVLHYFADGNGDDIFTGFSEDMSLQREELDTIIDILHASGAVDVGFSTIELSDDRVLKDIVRGLYSREVSRTSPANIRDLLMGDKGQDEALKEAPAFEITIPATPGSERVVLGSLEQIAGHFHIPSEVAGQMQIALIELVRGILPKDVSGSEHYHIKFSVKDNVFSLEIATAHEDFTLTDEDRSRIMPYLDSVWVEKILKGSKIVMTRKIK